MRVCCSNYCNMQYWLSSTRMLIINPCYEVHHVHGSRSDGMDHQWFYNTILIDIIKMTFLYILLHYIYYFHLSAWYILWCGNMTTLIIPKETDFILMLFDQNEIGLKYEPNYSNYCNMQYWLSSIRMLIINPWYEIHHVHGIRSDGMDHQWL